MRMMSIASGSSGNSIYVGSDTTHILVDAGISKKRIEEGLHTLDLCGDDIDALLITHEHSDHIGGLGVFLRKYNVPVYATEGTIEAIKASGDTKKVDMSLFHPIRNDERFTIRDIEINAMSISHDAADPVAYRFKNEGVKSAVVTDLGEYNEVIEQSLKGLSAVYIEANHDIRMLETGPYPYQLKKRILGKRGHLSNEACGRLLSDILGEKMQHIFLSHLSAENNLPELAYESVRLEIEMGDTDFHGNDFPIDISHRDRPGMIIEL